MLIDNTSECFRLAREGKGWLAVAPGFASLETCPFGYALTEDAAIAHLLASPEYQRMAATAGWRRPSGADFIAVPSLDEPPPRGARRYGPPRLVFSR